MRGGGNGKSGQQDPKKAPRQMLTRPTKPQRRKSWPGGPEQYGFLGKALPTEGKTASS